MRPNCTIFGGSLHPPITLRFTGEPPVPPDQIMAQIRLSDTRDLPDVKASLKASKPRLAIVGGGPSINDNLEALKAWDGDVWAINGAFKWCADNGIEATFVAIDPHEIVLQWSAGVKKALLCKCIHPSVFDLMHENGAAVTIFDVGPGAVATGSSTASCCVHLAIIAGHKEVTFFGCESSYLPCKTHAYMHEEREAEMIVRCGGEDFLTAPDYFCQAMEMACLFREFPFFCKEESGGLLRALVKEEHYEVLWISDGLAKIIRPVPKPDEGGETAQAA